MKQWCLIFRGEKNCEKLDEDKYVKDQAVKIRDVQLQNQNIKFQDEFVKNNNVHGDYHNALEQIKHLELINKEICKDVAKIIRENKHFKRKKQGIKQL